MSPIISGGGSSGGSSPAGSDGQIQYNENDALAASPDFVWDDASHELRLRATANGLAKIIANAAGAELQINAADGDGGAHPVGGELTFKSGAGAPGGDLTIEAGAGDGGGDGGNLTIGSGRSNGGDGGEISIRGNSGVLAGGHGGNVNIAGGDGTTGGHARLSGGSPNGPVQFYSGDSNQAVELNNNGLFLPGAIDVSSLPTSNPGPGLMWNDAGTLKVGT